MEGPPMKLAWLSLLALAQADHKTSAVRGAISTAAEVRVVLKVHQSDAAKKENVKGEALLPKGGAFAFEDVPPGTYDLLIRPEGKPALFLGTRWVLTVEAGKPLSGLSTRLTPADAKAMVDEILVKTRPEMSAADAAKLVDSLGGRIMRTSADGWFAVDLPDDRQAEDMIAAFKAKPGVVDATLHRIRSIK
jgi:hypothetical protein